MNQYETVIGLEVHVELATDTKIFCSCSTAFGAPPNTHICPVCTGMPGTLPVLNRKVLEHALAVGLATNCRINEYSKFDRKNYFYPDNPQNYQISQLYLPICHDGYVEISTPAGEKRIGIHEIHMEEDAGKLIHDKDLSLVDYNRAGVPLIEIVSKPDMRNAEEVIAYLEKLRLIIQYLGASDCKLNEGSMRVDVNLSVRKEGETGYGTRTEMKNLNSFRSVRHAILGERERQIGLLEKGEAVEMETRRWDEAKGSSYSMRSKEDSRDYRYFPEPDLMPLRITQAYLDQIRSRQPKMREQRMEELRLVYDLPEYDCGILTETRQLADLFEDTVALGAAPKKVSNWLMGETLRLLKEREMDSSEIRFSAAHLAGLIALVEERKITNTVAKEVYAKVFWEDEDPEAYVMENGLAMVNDGGALRSVVEQVLADNPKSVEDYRGGKERALGFLVGQTMKQLEGRGDPGEIKKILQELL